MSFDLTAENVLEILHLIDDGFVFEALGQEFLSVRLGYEFLASVHPETLSC